MLVRRLRAELKNCVLQCQKTVGGKHEQSRSVVTSCTDFVRRIRGQTALTLHPRQRIAFFSLA
jgi:hypothetical protein